MQDTLEQRLDFLGLGEGVNARLEPIADSLARHLDAALDRLAQQIAVAPSTARFFYGRERIEADGAGLASHWQKLLAGRLDKSFAETAMRTGQRHARIGVDPRWHVASQATIVQALIRGVVLDGLAQAAKTRRGPLSIFDAAPPAQVMIHAEALADGLASVVGAVLFDLDLTFAGYVERLRLDAETALAAEKNRLQSAVTIAGRALDLAADGQSDDDAAVLDMPELAPLKLGTERLRDKVARLVEDLDLSGRAMQALGAQVLLGVGHLASGSAEQSKAADALSRALRELGPAAHTVANGLDDHIKTRRADMRRMRRGARELEAAKELLRSARRQSGLANDALAQLDTHLTAATAVLDRLGADCGAETRTLVTLDRVATALVAAMASASAEAKNLDVQAQAGCAQGIELEQATLEALEGIRVLTGLADVLESASGTDPERVLPMPDQGALAAHWHVL